MCEKNNSRPVSRSETLRRVRSFLCHLPGELWSSNCAICHRQGDAGVDLCLACRHWFPPLEGRNDTLCRHCGSSFAGHRQGEICEECDNRLSPYARLVVPWRYTWPLDRLIQRMKYRDERVLARVLGTVLAQEAARAVTAGPQLASSDDWLQRAIMLPDMLLGVPSRAARLQAGFDHASELTRWCAKALALPAPRAAARRIVDTGSLAGLSRAERQLRIRGAFQVDIDVADRHVAIIDDVLTTGATSAEFARELYDSGARSVELWVLARTPASPATAAP